MLHTVKLPNGQFRSKFEFKADLDKHELKLALAGFNYSNGFSPEEVEVFRSNFSFDYGKFDPKIVPSDIIPKPEDFLPFPFRLLSATIIAGGTWRATEFPENVLRPSTKLLKDKPVLEEHWKSTQNYSGIVKDPFWTPETKEGNVTIPAGIDGTLAIDTKVAPRLARSILAGGVYSNSVTVIFDWKMSHDYQDLYDFNSHVGEISPEDGKMIRRIATKVHDYEESSVVFLGADPFAKLRGEGGNLHHVDHTRNYHDSFTKEDEATQKEFERTKSYFISCGFTKDDLHLSGIREKINFSYKKIEPEMLNEKFLLALFAVLGLPNDTKPETLTEAQLKGLSLLKDGEQVVSLSGNKEAGVFVKTTTGAFEGIQVDPATADKLKNFGENFVAKSELDKVTAEKETLAKTVTDNEPLVKVGKQYRDAKVKEVVRLYQISAGAEADQAVIDLFEKAELNALDGLLKKYVGDTAKLAFKGNCKECGSTEFTFQSSLTEEDPKGGKTEEMEFNRALTTEELRKKYAGGSNFIVGK